MIKRTATLAALAATATLGTLATAVPAQAAIIARVCTNAVGSYVSCAAEAWFDENGDHLYLRDNAPDGAGAYVNVWVGGDWIGAFHHTAGADETNHWNLDVAENTSIELRISLKNNGSDVQGSAAGVWKNCCT